MAILLGADELLCRKCGKVIHRGEFLLTTIAFDAFDKSKGQILSPCPPLAIHADCFNPTFQQLDLAKPVIGAQTEQVTPAIPGDNTPPTPPVETSNPGLHLIKEGE